MFLQTLSSRFWPTVQSPSIFTARMPLELHLSRVRVPPAPSDGAVAQLVEQYVSATPCRASNETKWQNNMKKSELIRMDDDRFESTCAKFRHVLRATIAAKEAAKGTDCDENGVFADTAVLKCLLTGLTINQLLTPVQVNGFSALRLPDWTSVAALTRTIVEARLTMYSVAVEKHSNAEREFRLFWQQWHTLNERIRALKLVRSRNPALTKLEQAKQKLRSQIQNHAAFSLLPTRLKQDFKEKKQPRSALFESYPEIASRSGVLREHFNVQYQFLSQSAHTQPLAVRWLRRFEPNDVQVTNFLVNSLQYATAYLAFAASDFVCLFPKGQGALDSGFAHITNFWKEVFSTPWPKN